MEELIVAGRVSVNGKTVTELGASPKRVCICTDDRDADDLFLFGLDWVARAAVGAGISGLFMETHPRPEEALRENGIQSLSGNRTRLHQQITKAWYKKILL